MEFIIAGNRLQQEITTIIQHVPCVESFKSKFTLYYQPIREWPNYTIVKLEALARVTPTSKFSQKELFEALTSPPSPFLSKCLLEILYDHHKNFFFHAYIKKEKENKHEEKEKKEERVGLSLNISLKEILSDSFRTALFEYLEQDPIFGQRLTLEIIETDSIYTDDNSTNEKIKKFFHDVKKYGVKIAFDDFGKGNAALLPLIHYDFDYVKFDGDLIKNMFDIDKAFYFLDYFAEVLPPIGAKIIAEKVEFYSQIKYLTHMGISLLQGFHPCLGEPVPPHVAVSLLS